jgi:hypothetical protein
MSDANDAGRVMTDEEHAKALREQLKSLHASDLVYEMMVSLISFGYQKLGLTGDTMELRDLGDAHFAIEAFGALLRVSDGEAGDAQTHDLHSTLAQMQLGYVQALELSGGRPAAAAAEAAAEAFAEASSAGAPAAEEPEAAPAEPAAEGPGEPEAAPAEPAAEEPDAAPAEPAMKQPAVKKAGRKKPAVKKPVARKPAAKKPPVERPPADADG